MKTTVITLLALLTMSLGINAMSYEQARNEALFLTDKMAYELNLSDAQYEAAYEINLDYLMSVTGYDDVGGIWWERRNQDLRYILYSWQWDAFCAATYFYRPLFWEGGYWHFGVYARYPRRDYFYFGRPHFYASYRGGHSWRMNGGRSFYEHRRDFFRPGHATRDSHFGMRNGFDRGDYRGGAHGNSSTRITAGEHGGHGGQGWHIDGQRTTTRDNNGWRSSQGGGSDRGQGNTQGGRNNYQGGSGSTGSASGSYSGGRNQGGGTPSRSFGGRSQSSGLNSSSTPSRSYGGSSQSHGSAPTRSFGGSSQGGSRSSVAGSPAGSRGQGAGATRSSGAGNGAGRNGSSRR